MVQINSYKAHWQNGDTLPEIEEVRPGRADLSLVEVSGFVVETRLFPNVGHTIVPESAMLAGEFIRASLAPEPVASQE